MRIAHQHLLEERPAEAGLFYIQADVLLERKRNFPSPLLERRRVNRAFVKHSHKDTFCSFGGGLH